MKIILKIIKKICKIFFLLLCLMVLAAAGCCAYLVYRYRPLYEEYQADAARAVAESDGSMFIKNLSSYIYDDSGNFGLPSLGRDSGIGTPCVYCGGRPEFLGTRRL